MDEFSKIINITGTNNKYQMKKINEKKIEKEEKKKSSIGKMEFF